MTRLSIISAIILCVVWGVANNTARADDYAFLVGVSDYDTKQLKPLAYARSDILEFRDVLLEAGLPEENVVLLHDDVATVGSARYLAEAEKIRDELRLLIGALTEEDTLLVAFAGHGVQFKGEEESYFCPLDVDLEEGGRESLIAISEIYARLQNCPARRKLLLVDACRNDPQSRLSRSRADIELESVTSPQLTPPPEGVVALFSCAPGQEAFEHPDLEHGVFFYHVLQAFRGEENDDELVTLDELLAYTKRQTAAFARLELGALQTPRQRGFFEGEWILTRVAARDGLKSIVKDGDREYALADRMIVCRESGRVQWSQESDGDDQLIGLIVPKNVGKLFVASDMRVFAFDSRTGDLLWTNATPGRPERLEFSPSRPGARTGDIVVNAGGEEVRYDALTGFRRS